MENNGLIENQKVLLTIKRIGINGEGIAYYKRKAVFIPNAIPGEVVEVKITKNLEKLAYGEVLQFKNTSEYRIKPRCEYYGRCGGCQLQHIDYKYQLEQKRLMVEETIEKFYEGNTKRMEIRDCIGMDNPWEYRNKTQLPTRHDGDKVVVGIYEKNSNRLVYINKCLIENKLISETMTKILDFLTKASIDVYNPRFQQGNLRYIVLRGFEETNEVQATFVLIKNDQRLIRILKDVIKIDNVMSVNYTLNSDVKSIDIISGEVININGKNKVDGKLGDLNFEISPNAFFQLNSKQTVTLYDEVLKALNPKGNEKVLDLYCGIGSIGLYLAKSVSQVRGIDINADSIDNANEFAKKNGLTNAVFYSGNILKQIDEKLKKEGFTPDCVVIDPPRKGIELQVINYLQKSSVKKIIYVSCNPATLVKNLNHLQKEYVVRYLQPIDMFPQTSNVECVVCLERR